MVLHVPVLDQPGEGGFPIQGSLTGSSHIGIPCGYFNQESPAPSQSPKIHLSWPLLAQLKKLSVSFQVIMVYYFTSSLAIVASGQAGSSMEPLR